MTAAAVSATIAFLVEQVLPKIISQYPVSHKITVLRKVLQRTREDIENAEKKERKDLDTIKRIEELRDISYSLEDELHKYHLLEEKCIHPNSLLGYACIFEFLVKSHQISTSFDRLQKEIEEIPKSSSTCGTANASGNEPENEDLRRRRQSNASEEEFSFVGLQNDLKILKDKLLDTKVKRRCCISVVGTGGLGKTTIAKKVYKDIKKYFDFSTWVYISQEFKIKDVLEKLQRDITNSKKEKDEIIQDEKELEGQIKEFLICKKYLVVLDDVRNCQPWQNLKNVFPDKDNGSRLLLTTRYREVAEYVDGSILHYLRPLDERESWELFCQKTSLIPGEDPDILLDLGKRITMKCGGLPFAIVVLGGFLSRKSKDSGSWKRLLDRIDSRKPCKAILAMSYDDLPYKMQHCFLYFALLPKDTDISAKKLIQFWVAEKLVARKNDKLVEDKAQKYLKEFIARSLVEVTKREHGGGVKQCRMHDLLRDYAIEKAKENDFLYTPVPESQRFLNIRRLSILSEEEVEEIKKFNLYTKSLRSLFLMSYTFKDKVEEFIPKMQLLRILDMPNFPLAEFPKVINQLIHLRYLGLRFHKYLSNDQNLCDKFSSIYSECCFKFLNPSVTLSNLKLLETLNFSGSVEISHSIWTLRNLRHLYGKNISIVGDAGDQRIVGLKQTLQTLHLRGGNWMNNVLEKLSNLRDLRIDGELSKYYEGLSKALCGLNNLRVLELSTIDKIPKLLSLSHMFHLKKMVLSGPMEIDKFPSRLVKVIFLGSKLQQEFDPFSTLQSLAELKYLKLETEETVNEINIFSGGFPKLEKLEVTARIKKFNVFSEGFSKLEKLELTAPIEKFNVFSGGFPKLEKLELTASFEEFNVFPGGFPKLEKLELTASFEKFNVFPRGFPKLEVLELKHSTGEFNVFSEGFSTLKKLRLDMLEGGGEFNDFSEAFPKLEVLELKNSIGEFNVFSEGFSTLKKLRLDMSEGGGEFNDFSEAFPNLRN